MQSQSNANGTDQNTSNISKRAPYIIGGALVFGIIGYYYYKYLQQLDNDKNQEREILKINGIKQPKSNSQSIPKLSQSSSSNTNEQTQSSPCPSKAKPKSKSKSKPHSNGIIKWKITKIWEIDTSKQLSFDDYLKNQSIKAAASALSKGELIGFPTETVYGLGANAFSNTASNKIFTAKGRPSDNPLIVHISEISQLYEWILNPINNNNDAKSKIHPVIKKLMKLFWPGPLSIIFPYNCDETASDDDTQKIICSKVRGSHRLKSVAIRMPSNNIARALISLSGCPIAAPSANISGRPSPTQGEHVIKDMNGKIHGILDCGEVSCKVGLESTVIKMDAENDRIIILRPGGITKEMILREIKDEYGNIDIVYAKDLKKEQDDTENKEQHSDKEDDGNIVEAPGMKYRHYAPKKPLYLVEDADLFGNMYWFYKAKNMINNVVFIITKQNVLADKADMNKNIMIIGDGNDLNEIASNLFKILRKIDDERQYQSTKLIFCEVFEKNEIGVAIMNRLDKASQSNTIVKNLNDLQSIPL